MNGFTCYNIGVGWFLRFRKEQTSVRFANAKDLKQCELHTVGLDDWASERDAYILNQRMHRFPSSREAIFVAEAGKIKVPQKNGKECAVVVSFTVNMKPFGPWICIHKFCEMYTQCHLEQVNKK